ncbi:MAG: NACHT domain-containing protein [Pegethrix bostrychoides GSE-TBD4-15B]|jgi:hypothetical protein|uniref:NACHT domain-containing protein n=1 Tax=Pegethrix bostrychoides GSE-TBD4-15B TaxID=2839662 RepID=A0A951U2Y8_9CYAN|nr:NACHT domain-containing protein [Pegethrix bostrychoides GSE-TBD4-15B]
MPRPNYSSEVQKRSQTLLALLLGFANDALDCDEAALDRLRPQIQAHWQQERRLVIRTKVRFLEALSQLAATPLNAEQIKESLKRLEDFVGVLEDNRPSRGGSEVWHFTLNLWHGRNEQTANLSRFAAEWESRRSQKTLASPLAPAASPAAEITDWLSLCQTSLQAQQYERLTTNPLTVGDGLSFALEQIYLPLELVERRQQTRQEQEISPARGSQLYEVEEAAERISAEDFLAQLLQADSPQRLAIIGEPGAGKTTLLQKTAAWLLSQQALPIWISLADLQGATLENYLLNDWLKAATRKVSVPSELQEALGEQFNQGRCWLLLDAIDEMAIEPSVALSLIAHQLRGWVADAHVILTCRSNLWDAGKNTLEDFKVYRNSGLSETDAADQIGQFIQRWFATDPELGASLQAELSQRRRIQDTVRNPLRLALLCRAWSMARRLPQTKAMLYQQFVEAIYGWKQDRFPTTLRQRQQLNSALAQLALKALTQDDIKFRLPQRFVDRALESCELLELALQLGWLNQVGVAITANGRETIYAFYHPTFQEYFAAQAVTDWHWFIDTSAIFSPQWRQPILLWLGRIEVQPSDKEDFMAALCQFADDCGGFYCHQAYLLAAVGLAEFPEASQATAIIQQLIRWRFGEFDPERGTWKTYPSPLQEAARVALLQTDRAAAVAGLEQFLTSDSSKFARWTAAYSLGKTLDPGNSTAVRTLIELLKTLQQPIFQIQLSEGLAKISPGHKTGIAKLEHLTTTLESNALRRKAAYSLAKLAPDNPTAVQALRQIAQSAPSSVQQQAVENLRQLELCPKNSSENNAAEPKQPKSKSRNRAIAISDPAIVVSRLETRLQTTQNPESQRRFAHQLGLLQPGHPQATATLLMLMLSELILREQSRQFYKRTADCLQAIILPEQLAPMVVQLRQQAEIGASGAGREQALECYKLLWQAAQKLPYAEFRQAWQAGARQ